MYPCTSPAVPLINDCFTSCTGRRSRTDSAMPFMGRIGSRVLDMDEVKSDPRVLFII